MAEEGVVVVTETQRTGLKLCTVVLLDALITDLQAAEIQSRSSGREVGKEGVVGPAATCARMPPRPARARRQPARRQQACSMHAKQSDMPDPHFRFDRQSS